MLAGGIYLDASALGIQFICGLNGGVRMAFFGLWYTNFNKRKH